MQCAARAAGAHNSVKFLINRSSVQTSVAPMQFEPRHFMTPDLIGMILTAVVDSGAAQSYLGKGISTILKGKFSPLSSMVRVTDETPVASQGILKAMFSIDGMEKTMPLNISDDLQYEGLLGIDFLRLFNIRINYEDDTWSTEKRIYTPFLPLRC